MSSQSSPQTHEPTMEEILASIRKIISEDQAEPAAAPAAQAAPAPDPEVEPEAESDEGEADVLELTQEVREEPPANVHAFTPPHRESEPQPEPEPELEVTASAAAGSEVPAADDVAFVDQNEEVPMASAGEDLITDNARVAMARAFAPYHKPSAAAPAPQMPPLEGAQLESVFMRAVMQSFDPVLRDWMHNNSEAVVQSMKPIIREWMDENLPDLIERAVKSEMAAAVRMATRKR